MNYFLSAQSVFVSSLLMGGLVFGVGPKPRTKVLKTIEKESVEKASSTKISFDKIWSSYIQNSKQMESMTYERQSAGVAEARAARHWLPRLYLNAQSFYTNDPGSILFSKLGERSITGQDFNPTIMNFPNSARHEKMDVGLQWMLYEGGLKSSLSSAARVIKISKESQEKSVASAEYSTLLQNYGRLLVLSRKKSSILPLQESLQSTLGRYQIGQSSNPLGYSGLLGLKSLKVRIQGEILMLEAQKKSLLSEISKKAALGEDWEPVAESLNEFIQKNIQWTNEDILEKSYSVAAQEKASEALELYSRAEKSAYLPHVGLFAENQLYNNVDTTQATSFTVGAFVKWNIYEPTQRGSVDQYLYQAKAQRSQAEGLQRDQKIMFENSQKMRMVLRDQIQLANESLSMIEEQTLISQKLFKSGLINALQLTELFSKHLDVILARAQLEDQFLQTSSGQINLIAYKNKTNSESLSEPMMEKSNERK